MFEGLGFGIVGVHKLCCNLGILNLRRVAWAALQKGPACRPGHFRDQGVWTVRGLKVW